LLKKLLDTGVNNVNQQVSYTGTFGLGTPEEGEDHFNAPTPQNIPKK